VLDFTDHSYDGEQDGRIHQDAKGPSLGVFTFPQPLGHLSVDDRHRRGPGLVVDAEDAAAQERDAMVSK
jgi:hypothetical protein